MKAITADGKIAILEDGAWKAERRSSYEGEIADENVPKSKKFKPQQKRSRKFCITSYIDRDSLEAFLSSSPWVHHWAMATHDKDIDSDGALKEKHHHILLYTYDAKTSSALLKIFDKFSQSIYFGTDTPPQNTRVQILHDPVHQWRYLIHLDDPDKYQYDPQERICDSFFYWDNLEKSQTMTSADGNRALAMFEDFCAKTPTRTMIERYGNAFLYHIPHLEKAMERHYVESGIMAKAPDDLLRIGIMGSGYSEKDKQMFFAMLNYLEEQSFLFYGEALKLGLVERKE